MSQHPTVSIPAAATAVVVLNTALFSVVVPIVALILLTLAVRNGCARHPPSFYAFLASLIVISVFAGAFSSHTRAEAIAQALLSFFLGIPVLSLTSAVYARSRCQLIVRTVHTGLLFLSLSGATLLALLDPFFSIPIYLQTVLFIAYTLLALFRLIYIFFNPPKPVSSLRPITIHVATRRTTAIPINLSSVNVSFRPVSCVLYKQYDQEPDGIPPAARHPKRPSTDSGISIVSAVKLVDIRSPSLPDIERQSPQSHLYPQQIHHQLRPFLLCLFLAQIFGLIAYICAFCATRISNYKPSLSALGIAKISCTALSVMVTISACFLHAYNSHMDTFSSGISLAKSLSFSRSSRRASERRTTTNVILTGATASSMRGQDDVIVPLPPKSYASTVPSCLQRPRMSMPHSAVHPMNAPDTRVFEQSGLKVTDIGERGVGKCLVTSLSAASLKSGYGGSEESDQAMEEGSEYGNVEPRGKVKTHSPASPTSSVRRLFGFVSKGGIVSVADDKNLANAGENHCTVRELAAGDPSAESLASAISVATAPTKEPTKLKRSTTHVYSSTSASHPPSAFTLSSWNSAHTECTSVGLSSPVRTPTRKLVRKRRGSGSLPGSFPSSPGTSESKRSRLMEADDVDSVKDKIAGVVIETGIQVGEVASQGGLSLKRSFKMGDGRTLSPSLTLAAATGGTEGHPCVSRLVRHPAPENQEWETRVDGGNEKHDAHDGVILGLMNVASTRAGVGRTLDSQVVRTGELINEGFELMEDIATPSRKLVGRKEERYEIDSVAMQIPTPSPTPEKVKARTLTKVKVNSNKIPQPPPALSLPVFLPSRSEILCNTTTTAAIFTSSASITATTPPSTPTESACTFAPASPSLPGKLSMLFRGSSSSDLGEGYRNEEPLTTGRLSLSPPTKTQPVFLRSIQGEVDNSSFSTPRGRSMASSSSSSLRLSGITMGSVRNAIAGVWLGKGNSSSLRSGKSATAPSAAGVGGDLSHGLGEFVIMEDDNDDGDFRHLRDPFASPRAGRVRRTPSGVRDGMVAVDSSEDGHACDDVFVGGGGCGRRVNAWGRLPLTGYAYGGSSHPDANAPGMANLHYASSASSLAGPMPMATAGVVQRRTGTNLGGKQRKHRRERRTRKTTLTGFDGLKNAVSHRGDAVMTGSVDEDVTFDVEEALLVQRLLKSLDDGWEEKI